MRTQTQMQMHNHAPTQHGEGRNALDSKLTTGGMSIRPTEMPSRRPTNLCIGICALSPGSPTWLWPLSTLRLCHNTGGSECNGSGNIKLGGRTTVFSPFIPAPRDAHAHTQGQNGARASGGQPPSPDGAGNGQTIRSCRSTQLDSVGPARFNPPQ